MCLSVPFKFPEKRRSMKHKYVPLSISLIVTVILLLILCTCPASADLRTISPGGTIFIGEQNLDISRAVGSCNQIGWWANPASVNTARPDFTMPVSDPTNFFVDPTTISGRTGPWFCLASDGTAPLRDSSGSSVGPVFNVQDPQLALSIYDIDLNSDVTGGCVSPGDRISFRISSNLYAATDPAGRPNRDPSSDGFITIRVKDETGVTASALTGTDGQAHSIANQFVDSGSWLWGSGSGVYWDTSGAAAGVYSVSAVSNLNHMRDNYKNAGADFTGKTVSQTGTIVFVPPAVKIESNTDSVTQGNTFIVVITGSPKKIYSVWVGGTHSMTGSPFNQPPSVMKNQANVFQDPDGGPYTLGAYLLNNRGGTTLRDDVAPSVSGAPGNPYYAQVLTSITGTRSIGFATSNWTKAGTYTLRVENGSLSDSVTVQVLQGAESSLGVNSITTEPTAVTQNVTTTNTTATVTATTKVNVTATTNVTTTTTTTSAVTAMTTPVQTLATQRAPTETAEVTRKSTSVTTQITPWKTATPKGSPLPEPLVLAALGLGTIILVGKKKR
jgi:hypothetical protein